MVIIWLNFSNELDKPSPPRKPFDVSGMNDKSFTLSWEMPETDGGSKILEYIVEMRDAAKADEEYQLLGSTKGNMPNILVQNVLKGHSYLFRICAKNAIGISEPLITDEPILVSRRISKFGQKSAIY